MNMYLDLRKVFPNRLPPLPELAKSIGITVNELKHLLDPFAATVNQSHLNKVGNYLISQRLVHVTDLPDILYSKRYDSFWPMLSDRRRVELLTGCRKGDNDWREVVSAADWILQSNVQYRLTDDGNQARQPRTKALRRVIDARLVEAWDFSGRNHSRVQKESTKQYRLFTRDRGDRGLILFGSVKSNPSVELSIANCFGQAKAFQSQDDVRLANDRACPFMLLYRPKDPRPRSCCGGLQLSRDQPGQGPGIYYEAELGQPWEYIPSNEKCDAALVFYRFDRAQGNRLEMVLGGFSGRATQYLAEYLRNEDASIFSPTYSDRRLDVGVFIVKFTFDKLRKASESHSASAHNRARAEVIPLAKEILVDRVKPSSARTRKRAVASSN